MLKTVSRDQMKDDLQVNAKSSLSISLRCLSHPFALLSIGVLLLNDHVFKHTAPSVLTGKLSDFAGLFFFPFLLAVFIGLLLDRFNSSPRRVGKIAFAITIVWFTLIKTSPFTNTLMVNILEHFLGTAQIVRDPTDLIALVVLWPACRLWISIENEVSSKSIKSSAYLALGLASLATIATSPCPKPPAIVRLVEHENMVYALGVGFFRSSDGIDWDVIDRDRIPSPIYEELMESRELPMMACVPEDPQTCYRIIKDEQVLISKDGGNNWEILWRVPPGRRYFMERAVEDPVQFCPKSVDLGPYDMIVLGSGESHNLIIAMGNEGVLVRNSNGEILRQPVGASIPTPLNSFDPSIIETETLVAALFALITLLGMSNYSWDRIPITGQSDETQNGLRSWVRSPMNKLIAVAFLAAVLVYVFTTSTFYIPAVVTPIAMIAFGLTWWRMAQVAQNSGITRDAAITTALTAIGVLIGGWGPFALWTVGVLPVHLMAIGVAVLLVLVILIYGARRIKKVTTQPNNL